MIIDLYKLLIENINREFDKLFIFDLTKSHEIQSNRFYIIVMKIRFILC
jgi:hypothetical protein